MQKLSLILYLKFHQEYSILAPFYNNYLCIKNIQKKQITFSERKLFCFIKEPFKLDTLHRTVVRQGG